MHNMGSLEGREREKMPGTSPPPSSEHFIEKEIVVHAYRKAEGGRSGR